MNPIVLALAIKRLTQLVVEDDITSPLRKAVDDWSEGEPEGSLKERISYLVSCEACVSIWAAGAVLAAGLTPPGRAANKVLAGSQAALFASAVMDKLRGWSN